MGKEKQSALIEHTLQELNYRNRNVRVQQKPYVLALLTSHLIGVEPGLLYLSTLSKKNLTIRFSAEDELFTHYPIKKLVKLIDNDDWIPSKLLSDSVLHHVDAVFLPILSFSMVNDILSFNDRRLFVRIIMKALFTGKKVFGLKIGADPYHSQWKINGMDKSSNLLKRKLNKQMAELKTMGILLIDEHESLDIKIERILKKTVITEETIRYIHQRDESKLWITNEMIITPLARDMAKELNIALIIEGDDLYANGSSGRPSNCNEER